MGCDKSGLGYGATAHKGQAFTSHDLKTQAKGKLKVDQGDPSLHPPKGGKINKREVKPIFICHHCGRYGYIRPYCFELYGKVSQKDKNLNTFWARRQPYMSRRNTKIHEGVHNAKTFTKTIRPDFVKTKKIWVRKDDLTCLVVHTTLKARDSHMWYLDSGCSRHMSGNKS
ncbi:hypothetical protein CsSME_00019382 [Camellia sinensis var. sinensis]